MFWSPLPFKSEHSPNLLVTQNFHHLEKSCPAFTLLVLTPWPVSLYHTGTQFLATCQVRVVCALPWSVEEGLTGKCIGHYLCLPYLSRPISVGKEVKLNKTTISQSISISISKMHIDPVARLESFRALKLSRLENFLTLKSKTLKENLGP